MFKLYFDGACRGNGRPGARAGSGFVLFQNNEILKTSHNYIGPGTNNEAEYNGLLTGLSAAVDLNIKELTVYGDSKLVIEQMNNKYKTKAKNLIPLFKKCKDLSSFFQKITFIQIDRSENTLADKLANQSFD